MKEPDQEGQQPEQASCGDGAADDLPFPDSDFSPALQRTLRRKFKEAEEGGELEAVDREAFFKALGHSAKPAEGAD